MTWRAPKAQFAGQSSGFFADFSQIDELAAALAAVPGAMEKDASATMDRIAGSVLADAKSTVPVDTAALRDDVHITRKGGDGWRERWIETDEKQGFFLEAGTPTTGPPIPWLTAPAARGSELLFAELSKLAEEPL